VEAIYRGPIRKLGTKPLSLSFLKGLLSPVMDRPINVVNAPLIAKERGIHFSERSAPGLRDFRTLLTFKVATPKGPVSVSGTLFGRRLLRLVKIEPYRVEIFPEGVLLLVENEDKPGVVGKLGSLLGTHEINISNMHVAAGEHGHALCVLNLDRKPSPSVLEELRKLPEVRRLHAVELPPGPRFA
jgi:D-3-phosphoglycerate dehydrogenase